jgi:hypothetical protein
MDPMLARCRSCSARVELAEIAERHDGRCPSCGAVFSEGWTNLLVEECGAIDQLVNALVRSLRRLSGLPGRLELEPDALMKNLLIEVPWRVSIETEPALVESEIDHLVRSLEASIGSGHAPDSAGVRALANRLLGLATVLEANQEATDPAGSGAGNAARDAAATLEDAAAAIDRGQADADDLRQRLEAARTV